MPKDKKNHKEAVEFLEKEQARKRRISKEKEKDTFASRAKQKLFPEGR